jgi:hypothetical protein
METIRTQNTKKQLHGYQERFDIEMGKIWLRGNRKNGEKFGYEEINYASFNGVGDEGTMVNFYIK